MIAQGTAGRGGCTSGLGLTLLGHFALLPFLARRLSLLARLCSNNTFLWRLASVVQSSSFFSPLLGYARAAPALTSRGLVRPLGSWRTPSTIF